MLWRIPADTHEEVRQHAPHKRPDIFVACAFIRMERVLWELALPILLAVTAEKNLKKALMGA
jgi:hypothetical protein